MKVIELTKKEFLEKVSNYEFNRSEWLYLGDKPCVIDFFASWCGPCKMIAPIIEELAETYDESVIFYKVDTEKEQELSADFGIRSIPSLLFVPMIGKPQMYQGALSRSQFKESIQTILLESKGS